MTEEEDWKYSRAGLMAHVIILEKNSGINKKNAKKVNYFRKLFAIFWYK